MPSLINTIYREPEMFIFFTEKVISLRAHKTGPIHAGLYATENGFVYYYDSIFAFSDLNNKVSEVLIADKNKLGLTLIHTNEASRTQKQLIRKLEEFLTVLNEKVKELCMGDDVHIEHLPDRTNEEIKEELIIQHAV